MTAAEAMKIVDHLVFTIQRMRSMAAEAIGSESVLATLDPWVYGDKCLLPALARIQDRGLVDPGTLHNLCYIAHELDPAIAVSAQIMATAWDVGVLIPEPDMAWLTDGWQEDVAA